MKNGRNQIKRFMMAAVAAASILAARDASACYNDDDCPDPACGGQVCDWTMLLTCQPARPNTHGSEGWCMDDTDCKCAGAGATCVINVPDVNPKKFHCTFTTLADKPAPASGGASGSTGGASGASGGASGTGGSASGTGGAAAGTGGASTGTGGAAAGTGGSNSGTGGTKPSSDSGGCSVAGVGASPSSWLSATAALGAFLAFRRRRRS